MQRIKYLYTLKISLTAAMLTSVVYLHATPGSKLNPPHHHTLSLSPSMNHFKAPQITIQNTPKTSPPLEDTSSLQESRQFEWQTLTSLPDTTGFAGAFVGVAGGALIFAGGANFPEGGAPWKGSSKVWYDTIYALDNIYGTWKVVGHLPKPLGYGVTVNWKDHMLLVGGSNALGHYADVWLLSYKDGNITLDTLPSLPAPLANTSGALAGNNLYIAGGQAAPDAPAAMDNFWMLNLVERKNEMKWKVLPSWPGRPRMLSIAGAVGHSFYLCSGADLEKGKRVYLKDAFVYNPQNGWQTLPDLPGSVVAAPGPAFQCDSALYIFGGDDGRLAMGAENLKDRHPGFSDAILQYDSKTNIWSKPGNMPLKKGPDAVTNPNGSLWAPVTTTLTVWQGKVIIAGGEIRPSTRTPHVLMATPVLSPANRKVSGKQ